MENVEREKNECLSTCVTRESYLTEGYWSRIEERLFGVRIGAGTDAVQGPINRPPGLIAIYVNGIRHLCGSIFVLSNGGSNICLLPQLQVH